MRTIFFSYRATSSVV